MSYTYKQPEGDKYKVSMRDWNKIFEKRGSWPLMGAEVYVNSKRAIIQYVPTITGKVAFALCLPVLYLYGIFHQGVPETNSDVKDVFFCKSRGSFSSDRVWKGSSGDGWQRLNKLIKRDESKDLI